MPTTRPRRIVRRAVMVLAGVALLVVLYASSYAPYLRWRGPATLKTVRAPGRHGSVMLIGYAAYQDGEQLPMYRPVDWVIDETALRMPLFAWARFWSVEDVMRKSSQERLSN